VATAANVQSTPPAAVPPPAIAAKAYFLLDVLSGEPLVAQNADEPREPASLTKLMTAYLTFQALRDKALIPSQMVTVSEKAWRAEGSRMFIEPRKAVSVDELPRAKSCSRATMMPRRARRSVRLRTGIRRRGTKA
jgi:D-alanyl-D-alanine carboxypeptidase